jgi:hypothetical protein
VRSALAVRGRPQVTGGPSTAYLGHLGFALIALADGFAVVATLRAGLPVAVVTGLALGVVAVGHVGIGLLRRRLVPALAAA